ncbi:MAG: sulfatase-like hydrolase/transferase, partial [Cyclobacteriaceae bacterium]
MFQIFKKADNRSVFILLLVVVAISISTLTRIALLIKSSASVDFTVLNVLGIFFLGFAYDLLNTAFAIIPIVLYCWMVPGKFFLKKWHKYILFGIFFVFTFLALFNAIAEWFFWDEFNTRFNFIAVDYLVYTNEVIGNIRQSYPIEWIIVAIGLVAIAITFLVQGKINQVHQNESLPLKQRSKMVIVYSVCLVIAGFFVTHKHHRFSENAYVNELAGNGLFELFAAYRNNELNYGQFYAGIDNERAFSLVHQMIQTPESSFTPAASQGIERKITNEAGEKKLNVVLISVESFSADFMAAFGNKKGITPFLDSLAQHSLLFTNLYATGTRTVRGLEALSLCVPPTPGQSIVRRPNNENLFSLGKVFREKGYESKYIYGGYGYFDNMNYFFGNNGYTVVDRSAINDEDIDYENVWGVADENLFELALSEIDKSQNTNVFAHIMTTSNHRPYT